MQNKRREFPAQFHYFLALAFFGAATIVMTYPLVAKISTQVIGSSGDNLYYVWLIGWFRKCLFLLGQNPLFVPVHNYPYGWNLAYSEITLSNVILALPFSLLGGDVFGYNVAILISFVLSGFVVYWWVYKITKNSAASLLSGFLFAFAPYRIAHAYGHLPLMGTQWLALHYAGLYFMLTQPSARLKYAILAGVGFGLAGLSSMYYLYMQLVLTPLLILIYFLFERRFLKERSIRSALIAYGLISLSFAALAAVPYFSLARASGVNHQPFSTVDVFSASLTDFIFPSVTHFIWGSYFRFGGVLLWIERNLNLGVITLVLAGIAVASHGNPPGSRKKLLWLGTGGLIAMVLALGTSFHWLGKQVTMATPSFLHSWLARPAYPIPTPGFFLWKFLPYYDNMRVWDRYGIFTMMFFSVIAGVGAAKVLSSIRNRKLYIALSVVLILWSGVEFFPSFKEFITPAPREVDVWLSEQPGNGAVVQFPIKSSTEPSVLYGTLTYDKPFIGMFYGAYFPEEFQNVTLPVLEAFPDEASISLLKERGVQYVLVDASQYKDWSDVRNSILGYGLIEQGVFSGVYVYEIGAG